MYESFSLPQEFKFQVWNFLGKNLQSRKLYCYYFGTRQVEADTVENKRRPLHISWGIEHGSDDNNPVYRPFPPRVIFGVPFLIESQSAPLLILFQMIELPREPSHFPM